MMIKCKECRKEYSDNAYRCPNCGSPSEKTMGKWNIIWDIAILLLLLVPFFKPYYLAWVIGIILMWVKKTPDRIVSRIIITAFFGMILFVFIVSAFVNN